jgi:hypothetical protein
MARSLQEPLQAETWFGFVTTAGTPPDVIAKLNAEINAILSRRRSRTG